MRFCKVIGCVKKHHAKGYCKMHYNRKPGDNKTRLGHVRRKMKTAEGIPYRRLLEYNSWLMCRRRCEDKSQKNYNNYGGKGITVCDRWNGIMGFINFYEDMGRKPGPEYELDRIDSSKGYYKDNCQWLTKEANLKKMHGSEPDPF